MTLLSCSLATAATVIIKFIFLLIVIQPDARGQTELRTLANKLTRTDKNVVLLVVRRMHRKHTLHTAKRETPRDDTYTLHLILYQWI